jgi:hypothetical protein
VLGIHQELQRTAFLTAGEALIGVAAVADGGGAHDKIAVIFIVMEGAQSCEVHASLAELHEVADNIFYPCRVYHPLNHFIWDLWHSIVFLKKG